MKLLYITSLSGKRINGFMRSAIVAARSLGLEFTIACNMNHADKELYRQDCQRYGIKAVHIDFARNPLDKVNYTQGGVQLLSLMKQEQFDIVHCNTPIGGVMGRICARRAHVPFVIYQAHGFHFWKGAPLKNWLCYYPVEWMLARYTDRLITINDEDYHRACKFRLKKSGHVIKVPGVGIDVTRFSKIRINKKEKIEELDLPGDAIIFIAVGEINSNKNFDMLIHAFEKINMSNIYLLICGDGKNKNILQKTIDELGLESHVRLLGFRSDIPELLSAADVFLFPSKREGLPGALMEAMAKKLPCIASKIRGNTDLLGADYDYLLPPEDVDAWADAMKKILKDRRDLGLYLYERVKPFDFPQVVECYKKVYQDAIERRRSFV